MQHKGAAKKWSGELADRRIDDRVRFSGEDDDRIDGVDNVDETIAAAERWLK